MKPTTIQKIIENSLIGKKLSPETRLYPSCAGWIIMSVTPLEDGTFSLGVTGGADWNYIVYDLDYFIDLED